MSLPPFPSTSGDRPADLHVYTVEECQNCGQKTKRDFKVGDFVMGEAGICEKCQGKKTIALIYGERALTKTGRGNPHGDSVREQGRLSNLGQPIEQVDSRQALSL